jgi:two-component system cell cycle sensor histidine kinase/response regulator CckA
VVVNLALNAIDAMAAGGTLTIEAENVEGGASGGERVRLRVSDDGVGMGPETVAHAFEPFFTTKPAGHGAGLGLASAFGIVTAEGGEIAIESELGRGTTLTMLLPVRQESQD